MPRRAPKNAAKGASGESFVQAEFEELGWGVSPIPTVHDIGTDLLLMPRDEQRFDLQVLAGAQVKSLQADYFTDNEARDESGELLGWWYYEAEDSHFSYWANHASSHFVVLRNQSTRICYWVHVTKESLTSTGKGVKILLPVEQTLDEANRSELLKAATSSLTSAAWDGSVWNSSRVIPSSDLLRYGLLTPRLAAPHPNSGEEVSTASQAIALLTQQRRQQLDSLSSVSDREANSNLRNRDDWAWSLFDAYKAWLDDGRSEHLDDLSEVECASYERAALGCVRSLAAIESGDPQVGLTIVQDALDCEDLGSVDRAWLQVHEARLLVELGQYEDAVPLALEVQQLRVSYPLDPTAMALVSAATSLVFGASPFGARELGDLIQSSDTVARWWRSQTLASGLGHHFDSDFRAWSNDQSTRIVMSDSAADALRSVCLMAGLAADGDAWKYASSLLGRRQLMLVSNDIDASSALTRLLRSGDEKSSSLAVRHMVDQGPLQSLRRIASDLDLTRLPRSAMQAHLKFLRYAGDVLDPRDADRHVQWVLSALSDIDSFVIRYRPTYLPREVLVDVLAGCAVAVSDECRRQIVHHILSLDALSDDDQLLAKSYGNLLRRIDPEFFTDKEFERLSARADDNFEFENAANTIIAHRDPSLRSSLLSKIRQGNLGALGSFGDVGELPPEIASEAIDAFSKRVEATISQAKSGMYSLGQDDAAALTLMFALFPDSADWDLLYRLFTTTALPSHEVYGSLITLSQHSDRIARDTKDALLPAIDHLRTSEPVDIMIGGSPATDSRWAASEVFGLWNTDTVDASFMRSLLRSGAGARRAAAHILAASLDSSHLTLLSVLIQDEESFVRREAATGLSYWILRGVAVDEVVAVLLDAVGEDEVGVALAVSRVLAGGFSIGKEVPASILDKLENHPNAIVRKHVNDLRAASSTRDVQSQD